jgi:hypothetical protein
VGYDVPKIDGRVLSIRPAAEGSAVLLDVGKKQGVEPKWDFMIVRSGRLIGKVLIERVEAEVSSGPLVWAKDGETIREGDAASTRP